MPPHENGSESELELTSIDGRAGRPCPTITISLVQLILAAWEPSDTIAVVAISITGVIGLATLVANHKRETALHRRTLEAERAKELREQAMNAAYSARDAAYQARSLAKTASPTSQEEVKTYLQLKAPASGASVHSQQAVVRFATLGWNEAVRSSASELSDLLLKLNISIQFPEMAIAVDIPEAAAIAGGDRDFWERYQSDLASSADEVDDSSRTFLEAIAN